MLRLRRIAPIEMDTGRPEGRTVGMKSGTGVEKSDGVELLKKIELIEARS